jgi:hypothetical protein
MLEVAATQWLACICRGRPIVASKLHLKMQRRTRDMLRRIAPTIGFCFVAWTFIAIPANARQLGPESAPLAQAGPIVRNSYPFEKRTTLLVAEPTEKYSKQPLDTLRIGPVELRRIDDFSLYGDKPTCFDPMDIFRQVNHLGPKPAITLKFGPHWKKNGADQAGR